MNRTISTGSQGLVAGWTRAALALAFAAAIASSLASDAAAQSLYRYVDPQGNVHFVDSPSKVPAAQRNKATVFDPSAVDTSVNSLPDTATEEKDKKSPRTHEPAPALKPEQACRLVFKNRRSRDEENKIIYTGDVMNAGPGLARGIEVDFVDYDKSDHVIEKRTVAPVPSTLNAREMGSFQFPMKRVERSAVTSQINYARSAFQARLARCD
jgi:hypothetical protein